MTFTIYVSIGTIEQVSELMQDVLLSKALCPPKCITGYGKQFRAGQKPHKGLASRKTPSNVMTTGISCDGYM